MAKAERKFHKAPTSSKGKGLVKYVGIVVYRTWRRMHGDAFRNPPGTILGPPSRLLSQISRSFDYYTFWNAYGPIQHVMIVNV